MFCGRSVAFSDAADFSRLIWVFFVGFSKSRRDFRRVRTTAAATRNTITYATKLRQSANNLIAARSPVGRTAALLKSRDRTVSSVPTPPRRAQQKPRDQTGPRFISRYFPAPAAVFTSRKSNYTYPSVRVCFLVRGVFFPREECTYANVVAFSRTTPGHAAADAETGLTV